MSSAGDNSSVLWRQKASSVSRLYEVLMNSSQPLGKSQPAHATVKIAVDTYIA